MYYFVFENINLIEYKEFVYDFLDYNDIRELYLILDILIIDYFLVFFDFVGLKRLIFFYVFDIEFYRDNLRGFYYDFEKCVLGFFFKIIEKVIEVIYKIKNYKQDENIILFYD